MTKKNFIYNNPNRDGFNVDLLFSEEDRDYYTTLGIFKGYSLICEVSDTKQKGTREHDGRKYRVFKSLDGTRTFNVFSDSSVKEVK